MLAIVQAALANVLYDILIAIWWLINTYLIGIFLGIMRYAMYTVSGQLTGSTNRPCNWIYREYFFHLQLNPPLCPPLEVTSRGIAKDATPLLVTSFVFSAIVSLPVRLR
ncbi:hypothetical protein KSX_29190 [Ktedonospora formicarum]|uniref:Uncharacterized protein n=1 Tax=Ktedonospora formicarum TaxID=2778364 RepID=A0A8J3MSD7_9CHLR|nr:hypothetical protein KSX_29190 [Ktedonospora formicarum]